MDAVSKHTTDNRTEDGRWRPGHSGNPATQFGPGNKAAAGRKNPINEICAEVMDETREAIKEQMKATLTSRGMAGVLLLRELFDRLGGKVTQGVELSGSISNMTEQDVDERVAKLFGLLPDEPGRDKNSTP